MDINLQTKISDLLEAYPALEETLLELSPVFSKLRNPVLRRTIAKVATIQQAAKMAEISPAGMVLILRQKAGLIAENVNSIENDRIAEEVPPWFDKTKIAIHFDASPIIEAGQSPMAEIIALSKTLEEGMIMELVTPFRPEPIIDLLRSKGLRVWYSDGKSYFIK